MKKIIYSILLAGLVALGLTSCSNGSDPDAGKPELKEFFYTNDLSGSSDHNIDDMERLKTIKVNHSNSTNYDFKYTLVVDFKDEDLDVCELHYSWDNFESSHKTLDITQEYVNQYSWWNGIGWKMGNTDFPLEITAYLVDEAGNRSDMKKYTVNTVFGD